MLAVICWCDMALRIRVLVFYDLVLAVKHGVGAGNGKSIASAIGSLAGRQTLGLSMQAVHEGVTGHFMM